MFWEFSSYSLDDAPAGSGLKDRFEIFDSVLSGNGGSLDQLAVTVTSKKSDDSTIEILNLILSETTDNGIFGIDHMLFMVEEAEFALTNTALITIEDPCDEPGDTDGNCNPAVIETLSGSLGQSVIVYSDTTGVAGAIAIDLIETGPNTGIFTRQLRFTTGSSDAANAILKVSSGDVFTIEDQKTSSLTNGLIKGDPNRFAIFVEINGSVEVSATQTGSATPTTHSTDIIPGFVGGRGSGGLVNPGLVVDNPSSGGSGCSGDCEPPTLGVNSRLQRLVYDGFSYNGNPTNVELYYTPYPLIQVKVGQENLVVLKVYDDTGIQNIEHIALAFGLGEGESFNDSKATINLDITREGREIVSLYDPENVLDNVRIITEKHSCGNGLSLQCLIVKIYHTFREPLNFNMVATYVWDFNRNAWQNYYNHGIDIVGESINPPKTKLVAFGSKEMRGLFELTQIDKKEDKWIDEYGNIYQHKENNRFDKIYTLPQEIIFDKITSHGCDRACNWFSMYKLTQELLAEKTLDKILDGKKIKNESLTEPFSHTYNFLKRSEDPIIQLAIKHEIERAEILYEKLYGK